MRQRKLNYDNMVVRGRWATRADRVVEMQERANALVKLSGVGGGTGDMAKSTYDTDNNGVVDLSENVALAPSATGPVAPVAGDEGKFFYFRPGGGAASVLYFCISNSAGSLEWIFVGQSS